MGSTTADTTPSSVHEEGTGAVRSNDLAAERWDLISGAAVRQLFDIGVLDSYEFSPKANVELAIDYAWRFLGYREMNQAPPYWQNKIEDRNDLLARGWWCLATAIQLIDGGKDIAGHIQSRMTGYGSSDHRHYPYYALRRLATTCDEGAKKYGEENWLHGFRIKGLLNHGIRHMVKWTNGDNTEDHLGHSMWSFMSSVHMWMFRREDMCPRLLGLDYSMTEELEAYHAQHKSRRPVDVPILLAKQEQESNGRTRAQGVGTSQANGTTQGRLRRKR